MITEFRKNIGVITFVVVLLFLAHLLLKRSGLKPKGLGA